MVKGTAGSQSDEIPNDEISNPAFIESCKAQRRMSDWETRLTLLERARDPSDQTAWHEFYAYYNSYVRVVLRKMTVNANDHDDLQQEVMLRVWKVLPDYKRQTSFRAWMSRVIHGKVVDHYRKKGRRRERESKVATEEVEVVSLPEVQAIMEEEWKRHIVTLALQRIHGHFTERAITAFQMSMDGKTANQIGHRLDIKPNSVNKLKNRVKLRMLQEIERLRHELEL